MSKVHKLDNTHKKHDTHDHVNNMYYLHNQLKVTCTCTCTHTHKHTHKGMDKLGLGRTGRSSKADGALILSTMWVWYDTLPEFHWRKNTLCTIRAVRKPTISWWAFKQAPSRAQIYNSFNQKRKTHKRDTIQRTSFKPNQKPTLCKERNDGCHPLCNLCLTQSPTTCMDLN